MIQDTITKIEENIRDSKSLDVAKKEELLGLVVSLKKEVVELSATNKEDAETVANFTKASTHEVIKSNKNKDLIDLSIKGLSESVSKFEASHPDLVSVVNSICVSLSNSGF
ncbi:MAG TPA: DUF4404 family protein [Leptospiraceae bacterium]|nr:DUF4404 family protein [Leptospiraceae bacterium]HMW07702.1 DUF4404 family protein [Leptospiraceae bacterium]HMX34093.1 DUF4404 family protein [Leptospiraceae bacterium]HMY33284.1 DUF4404 family protein [Leptospiraceae bacterium]HMZ63021.1 DUF4404 family protein [Leptospiraceae bacterium]